MTASRSTGVLPRRWGTGPHHRQGPAPPSDMPGWGADELVDIRRLTSGAGRGFIAANEFFELTTALAAMKVVHRHAGVPDGGLCVLSVVMVNSIVESV